MASDILSETGCINPEMSSVDRRIERIMEDAMQKSSLFFRMFIAIFYKNKNFSIF